jgi:riboflavin kinase/FMN adenylyltransferase
MKQSSLRTAWDEQTMKYVTTLTGNEPIAITIGNFDGVHRGHQRLMHELHVLARALNCKPVLVTFSPHTLLVVRPNIQLECLTTLEEKLALTQYYGGIDDSIVIHFTPEVAALSATGFMDRLRTDFSLRAMVVGEDFSLGHNRMGDITFLQEYGKDHDILMQPISLEESERVRISSTRIRTFVMEGKIAEANELLGHPAIVSGTVVKGDQRGRQLGYPTANLATDPHKLLPANGIYAVRVGVGERRGGHERPGNHEGLPHGEFAANAVYGSDDREVRPETVIRSDEVSDIPVYTDSDANDTNAGQQTSLLRMLYQHEYNGAASVGVRPMFDGKTRLVEVYLLDADLDLYGQTISLDFIERLRDEERFATIEALKAQMAADVQRVRQILQADA